MAHKREPRARRGEPERAEAAEAPAPEGRRKKPRKTLWESTRETLDSILVALVLASIFRTFVMEAFEIPTGSMAPTLYGRHVDVTCPACQCLYSVGVDRQSGDASELPGEIECPMCGTLRTVQDGPSALRYALNWRTLDLVGGDRILVDKGAYTLGNPKRWDVGVFVNPHNWEENYIKRVVGLPGDTIQIKNGDLYVDDRIARKPSAVQEVLWMPVFDADYIPNGSWTDPFPDLEDVSKVNRHVRELADGRRVWLPPWEPADDLATAWNVSGREFTFTPPAGDTRPSLIRFAWKVFDTYGYGQRDQRSGSHDPPKQVGDVRLRGRVTLAEPARLFATIIADKRRIDYVLSGDPANPHSSISINGERKTQVDAPLLTPGRERRFAFVNVDQQAWLEVDGERQDGIADFADGKYPPGDETEPARAIYLGASRSAVRFAHLEVDRDIYYTETTEPSAAYAVAEKLTLGQNEYFVLGDHSPSSHDSRRWFQYAKTAADTSQAAVKRDQFIGKALFLYWPYLRKFSRVKVVH